MEGDGTILIRVDGQARLAEIPLLGFKLAAFRRKSGDIHRNAAGGAGVVFMRFQKCLIREGIGHLHIWLFGAGFLSKSGAAGDRRHGDQYGQDA